jgi:hypothetical protein
MAPQVLLRLGLLGVLLVAGVATAILVLDSRSASAGSCGTPAAVHATGLGDRSWIRTDAVMYGANNTAGVFRLPLNSNRLEPIGHHAGAGIMGFEMSADRSKLIYDLDSAGVPTHWLYDIKTGRETELEALTKAIPPWGAAAYSADASKVAFVPRPGDGQTVQAMDLRTRRVRSFPLPAATPAGDTLLFGLTWSRDGSEVLVGRRWQDREDFWSINPTSGTVRKITGTRVAGPHPTRDSIHYIRDGADIGDDCVRCAAPDDSSRVRLADGARAVRTQRGDILVERQGASTITLLGAVPATWVKTPLGGTAISACDGVSGGIHGAIDGRYLIYSIDGVYWVYGATEKRRATLPRAYLVW